MKKTKGFTLVELLVVIVILGIITGISIPLIRNIQAKNEQRQYKTYQDSLKYSAKLYVDSYSEDLFGHSKSGCAIITYQQMVEKGLLKDITVSDVSCATNNTLVRAVMFDNKISYTPMIGCGKVVGGSVEVETVLPENGIGDLITCGATAQTILSFDATPRSSNSINYQRRNITVKMSSYTGFHENIEIYYTFVKKESLGGINPTLINTDENGAIPPEPTDIIEGWPKLEVNYIGGNEQKKMIEEGQVVTLSSESIKTPVDLTGDYYLVLRIENLQDLSGRNWTTKADRGKYVYLGTYKVDNTKPVFSSDSTVISSSNGYNNIKPKLKINVSDVYSTSGDYHELRMCTSYDSDSCSKKVSDIKGKTNNWVSYNADAVLGKIQNNYDGSTHTVYVTVGDAAGNYTTNHYTYKLATRYTLTYNSNGGNACDPSSKSVSFDSTAPKWGTLCTPTRSNYTFTGWNTKADGTGNTVTSDTTASGNTTVYAQWKPTNYTITYTLNGGAVATANPTSYNVTTATFTLNNPTRSGYTFKGWTGSNGTTAQTSVSIPKGSSGNKSYTANWNVVSYTITYDLGGGTVSTANPTSYNITTNTFTLNNPTRANYAFTGWTGSNGTTAQTSVSIAKGSTGNKSYKANWKIVGVNAYSVLKVGDYVDYYKYVDRSSITPTFAQTGVNNHPTQSTNASMKWRVLYINKTSKVVWLHPETAPNTVYLKGAQGFVNGPDTLHLVARTLYSSSSLGIQAKNMTIGDLETALGSGAVTAKNNSSVEGVRYGSTWNFYGTNQFIASAVTGGTDNGAISGTSDRYVRASSSNPVRATQSVFNYNPSNINSTVAAVLGTSTGWYATRGLVLEDNDAGEYVGFCMMEGKATQVEAIDMVDSNGYIPQDHDGGPYNIKNHPMVILPATIYVKEGTYGTSSNPWQITQLN